jgi:hypothetical protein
MEAIRALFFQSVTVDGLECTPNYELRPKVDPDAHVGDTDAASSVQSKAGAGIAGGG